LDISRNPIGNKGVKIICKAKWPQLTYLEIEWVNASSHILSYVQKLAYRKKHRVSFGFNYIPNTIWQALTLLNSEVFQVNGEFFPSVLDETSILEIKDSNPIIKR